MHIKRYILLVITLLVAAACSTEDLSLAERPHEGPVKVGFWVSDSQGETRTQINNDGHSVSWSPQDKVALWAKDANGAYIFQNQKFNLWFRAANSSKAYFATDLASPMTEGQYTYYACYPYPQSVNGTVATFSIPSTQDGKAAGGADIMVAQGSGEELKMLITPKDPADEESKGDYLVKDGVNLNMRHLVHALRFYVPQAHWGFGDEQIERIVFTMPSNNEGGTISGTVTADVSSGDGGLKMTANGSSTISLNLAQTIGKSMADTSTGEVAYDYAFATIMPGTYQGTLNAKVYSQTKASSVAVSFNGREMKAGHITPVGLNCSNVTERPKITFNVKSNNLGEEPYRITLTSANTSTQWRDGDDHVYEYYTGSESSTINEGDKFYIYYDEETLSTISGESVTVTYESKSAIVTETITMPTMSVGTSYNVDLNVPYLFAEDFSSVSAYNYANLSSINDDGNTGISMNDVGLIDWTGAAWVTTANTSLTVAAYIGSSINGTATNCTNGRVDTSTLPLKVKDVTISVSYKISGKTSASAAKNSCYFGTTTTAGAINATTSYKNPNRPGNLVDSYEINNGGSATNISVPKTHKVSGCSSSTRLTWCCNPTDVGTGLWSNYVTSKYFYIYLDDIKVKIVSE